VSVADIFVSYTSQDREWANWIGLELEALGHVPHIDNWEVSAGGNIMAWMEKRHDEADHLLCIVSETYLKKPYSSLERQAGQWAAVTARPNFVLPVFIEPCEAPTLLAPFKRCDLHGLEEEDARARLKSYLAPAAKPSHAPFPGSARASLSAAFPGKVPRDQAERRDGKIALSNIPIRVPLLFMGRDDALTAIEAALKRYKGRVAITALHGLRGVGKTTLAAAYAERHRGDYRATWWIRAQATSTLRADLIALGIRLGWVGVDDKEEMAVESVMERLRHEGDGILLIFDNAVDANALNPCLPRGGVAKVLVTSNAPNWRGIAEPVEIRLWPKEIGADFLTARTGRVAERAAAEALSQQLGGLPLAHEQAAAYCERLGISIAEYRGRFEATPGPLLDTTRDAPTGYHDGLTVAKTFALAIEEAAKLHPAAEPLIVYAALLAPEPIPLFLFSEVPEKSREKLGEPLATALARDGLDEAVAALRTFALVDRESIADERDLSITNDTIRVHRLVREIAAARREGEVREGMRLALIAALRQVYPEGAYIFMGLPPIRKGNHSWSARWRSGRGCSAPSIATPPRASITSPFCSRTRATSPHTATLRARADDRQEGARPWAPRHRDVPQQPRSLAQGPGRPCGGTAALQVRAGDLREDAGLRASRHCVGPPKPRRPAPGPGRPRRRTATLRARAGDLQEGAGPRE
jgi:TIR domain